VRNLIIHIGLPKTATTTLQRHVFPQFSGYVGKYPKGFSDTSRASREALWRTVIDKVERGNAEWPFRLRSALDRIRELKEDTILLSEEALSSLPRPGGRLSVILRDEWQPAPDLRRPVLSFLAVAKEHLSPTCRVRAIVTLRNQSEFLGSMYAEQQRNIVSPTQHDFEEKVHRALRSADPWLDYANLVEDLYSSLGHAHVLVLLHEDGIRTNISRISQFLNVPFHEFDVATGQRENVRLIGDRSWRGSDQVVPISHTGLLWRIRRQADLRWPQALRQLRDPLKMIAARIDNAVARVVPLKSRPGVMVTMPDALDAEVRRHCATSNRRLGELLNRDLSELGY
jgi:hypothetical protein